jgi:hypothetical protein
LGDSNNEVRTATLNLLNDFILEMKRVGKIADKQGSIFIQETESVSYKVGQNVSLDYLKLISILLKHLSSKGTPIFIR